jgi:hypothetical protein
MSTKHTPGPWTIHTDGLGITFIAAPEGSVAELHGAPEKVANARLIAAAPELLSVAKTLLLYVETYGGEVTKNIAAALPLYRAAIAKATGQGEG